VSLSVVYYSNNRVSAKLQRFCLETLQAHVPGELVCVIRPDGISHRDIYCQILDGIAASKGSLIALAEHDVLYPAGYFEALARAARAGVVYNTNIWRLSSRGYFRTTNPHLLSNCGAPREILIRRLRRKLAEGVPRWAEPKADAEFVSPHPTIDIRHGRNFTGDRHAHDDRYRKSIPYWGHYQKFLVG